MTGLDTGFFFSLQDQHPIAVQVWQERSAITSVIVLYELHRKLLKGEFNDWLRIIDDISESVEVITLNQKTALRASHIAHGTGMPGLDALILTSLLDAECNEIYTTDYHLELYQKKGIKIINLQEKSK